jgi:hypothetical protein
MKLTIRKTKFTRKVNGVKKTGYIGRVVTQGTKDFTKILKESVHGSTLDYREAELAVKMWIDGITENLKEGYIIDLGPVGRLYPSVETPWEEDPDDLKLSTMKGKVNYRPGDDILGAVKGASLGWASDKDKDKPTTDEEAGDEDNNDITNDNTGNQNGQTTVDTSTGSNNSGSDDIPAGNG